jgi:hypothetical protein
MNNGQCRFLNGDLDEYAFNECDQKLLAKAKEHINETFIWLGLTERFDESVLLLSKLLNWKSPPYYIRENVSKIRKSTSEISGEEIEVIKQYNQLDIELYEFANHCLDEKIAAIPNFKHNLQEFRDKNSNIQRRWGWLPDKLKAMVI